MALTTCSECQGQISDKAAACPHCGGPVRTPVANAMPVVVQSAASFKWWLWLPLGLAAAFLLYRALIPENIAQANSLRRVCDQLDGLAKLQCDNEQSRLRAGPSAPPPPLNIGFQAEPPQAASSAANEEIARKALYPELYKNHSTK